MNQLVKIKEFLLDILFPPLCLNCSSSLQEKEKTSALCGRCREKITVHTTLFCSVCRARLPDNKKTCHKNSSYLLGAATNYDEVIKSIIHRFKYKFWTRLENPLSDLLLTYTKNLSPDGLLFKNYTVIPVPLHKNREQERGFNQSERLAKIIAIRYHLPMEIKALSREKETKPQAELKNWEERKTNLAKSFVVANPTAVKGKNIILIDDVYTSGATINEAVQSLRSAGARKIIALVLAKTK